MIADSMYKCVIYWSLLCFTLNDEVLIDLISFFSI